MRVVCFQRDRQEPAYGILASDSQIVRVDGDIFSKWQRSDKRADLDSVRLLAPVRSPNILAIGMNYRTHALNVGLGIPQAPILFLKSSTAVIGPKMPIVLPFMAPNEVNFEAELSIVIGKRARNVPVEDTLSYILG